MSENMAKIDAEKILNLAGTYNFETVKTAYRCAVKENHPDTGGSNEKMAAINAAKDFFDNFFKTCSVTTSEICISLSTFVSDTVEETVESKTLDPFDIIKHPWRCDWKNETYIELSHIALAISNSLYYCDGEDGRPTLEDTLDFFDRVIDLGGGYFFANDFFLWGTGKYLRDNKPDNVDRREWMQKVKNIIQKFKDAELIPDAA